ncbi:unnamed protein product, partial [Strongylus vulgaris]
GFIFCLFTPVLLVTVANLAWTCLQLNRLLSQISDAACKLKNGLFHDQFPESQCVNHEHLLINFRVGCFEDSKKDRALTGFAYDFKSDNSVEKCRSHCYRAGFIYYGLEFGRECFCGDTLSKPTLDDSKCTEYRCSGNSSQFCGGFNAVEVFRTGLKGNRNHISCLKPSIWRRMRLMKNQEDLEYSFFYNSMEEMNVRSADFTGISVDAS